MIQSKVRACMIVLRENFPPSYWDGGAGDGEGMGMGDCGCFRGWGGVWTPHSGRPHLGRLAGRPYWRRGGYAPRSGAPALPGMDSRLGASATCLRRNDGENGRGRGWKVPDGCAVRRRRLHRCMWSATADVPHRRRLCDSPELLRGCGGDARKSRCGAVSTTRSARPFGDMGAWTRYRRWVE